VLPETHETITFDEKGVCSICRQHEYKKDNIDWTQRKKELDELIEQYRGKYAYDCIIPFSGGKDSTWTVYYLKKMYNIKPLVVQFDHGFLRPNLMENNKRTLRELGCDFHSFTPNWHIIRKLMLQSLIEKGDFCWHCHAGIFAYPMWVALRQQVPLIFWGETSAEYTSYYSYSQPEEVDEKRFNRYINLGINAEDMLIRLGGDVDERDLAPFKYPALSELRRIGYRSVCLGYYIPWDAKTQSEIISKTLGWKGDRVENVPPEYSYEKIECHFQGVRDYLKYIKRGYTRPCHLGTLDLRNGRITREQAMELIAKYENKRPASLDLFLELLNLKEEEFMEIAYSLMVSPYKHDASTTVPGERLHDQDKWSHAGVMPRAETEKMLFGRIKK